MRKWRNGTFLSLSRVLTVLTQEQADHIGVKVEVPFQGWALPLLRFKVLPRVLSLASCSMHTSQYSDGENRRGSRSGRTHRGSRAGRPRHESSIAKNCLRSSSTWTSGVHLDKESLPNAKVQKPDWNTSDQSSRRDCRVSTNPGAWIGAQRRLRRIRLHHHPQEVLSVSPCGRLAFRSNSVVSGSTEYLRVLPCIQLACKRHSVVWYSACCEHEGMSQRPCAGQVIRTDGVFRHRQITKTILVNRIRARDAMKIQPSSLTLLGLRQ